MQKSELGLFVGLVGLVLLVGLVYSLVLFSVGFSRELRYLNIEISRTRGAERRYWEKRRRRLWLSLIPFVKY